MVYDTSAFAGEKMGSILVTIASQFPGLVATVKFPGQLIDGRIKLTVLSICVEARLETPPLRVTAAPAGTDITTFPLDVIPVTRMVNSLGPPVTLAVNVPLTVLPAKEISEPSKPDTSAPKGAENKI